MRRAVGFTGTQHGMSESQKEQLRDWLVGLGANELHHGDCIGADAEADAIARELGLNIVIHPPVTEKKRAWCAREGDVILPPLPYLERNHDIAYDTPILIACPRTRDEVLRSGTWATVRYAKKLKRNVIILH